MRDALSRTIDARALAGARILVGIASVPMALEWFTPLRRITSGEYLVVPVVGTPPAWLPLPLFLAAVVAGLAMIVGCAPRLSSALVAATATVALLADQQLYSNHLVLLALLSTLIAAGECGRAWTWRDRTTTAQVPFDVAFLIRLLISSIYLWTAFAKLNPEYLSGDVLDTFLQGWVPRPDGALPALAITSVAVELLLAITLWAPRARSIAIATGLALHTSFLMLLQEPAPLAAFGLLMAAGYCAFAWRPQPAATPPRPPFSPPPARPTAPR